MAVNKEMSTSTETSTVDTKSKAWLAALALAVVTVAVYFRVTHQDFVHWDDKGHVTGNPYLQHLTTANLLHFWREPYEHLYIPISYMAFALLASIARMSHHDSSVTVIDTLLNPHVFHSANLVLHTINVLIVYAILRRIAGKASSDGAAVSTEVPAFLGALLFAVHPLQVESVAWISELRGQLASLFCLSSIYAYVAAVKQSEHCPSKRPAYWFALLLTVLGLLCKPSIITIGLMLLIIDHWLLGRSWRSSLTSAAPWLILAVPFTLITGHAQPVGAEGVGAVWQRPFIAGDALAFYLAKLFAPINLAIEYGRRPDVTLATGVAYRTTIVTVIVAAVIFIWRKGRPWLVAGPLMSIATLLPVLGFVPFAYQNYSTVADRYVYLAMLGPAIIVCWIVRRSQENGFGTAAAAIIGVATACYAVFTIGQVRYWDNSLTLFKHAIAVNPNSYGLRTNYGVSLDDRGRYDEAIAQYREAVRMLPSYPDGYQDMGVSLQNEGKLDEAMASFRKAVDIAPDYPLGHAAIGLMLLRQKKPAEALPELKRAAELAPRDPENLAHLAATLQLLGRTDEARDQYNQALQVDPANVSALTGLAALDLAANHLDDAESDCRRAIAVAPKDPKTHATLADVLQNKGDVDGSVAEYRLAVALDPSVPALHFALGSALFKNHDVTGAIPELAEAARLDPSAYHHDQLGVAYATAGNMAAARQEFEASIRVNPNYAPAQKHIGMLSR